MSLNIRSSITTDAMQVYRGQNVATFLSYAQEQEAKKQFMAGIAVFIVMNSKRFSLESIVFMDLPLETAI